VRIITGDIAFESNAVLIGRASLLLEIDENNHVHISPYKDIADGVTVTQIEADDLDYDPEFPNVFRVENDGYNTYKTFLLQYEYVYQGTTHTMLEELRLQFNEEDEEEFN
jgi:hypothetical protein